MKKVHIIGASGKTTSALAKMFIDLGWQVTGSDQGAYPPASTYLEQIGVDLRTPYDQSNLPSDVDLVVVGGNVVANPNNPEVALALSLNKTVMTYPQVLEDFLIKTNSIVVAGNFGKGTISGAIVKCLVDNGSDPSYMVGGQLEDLSESLKISEGKWSVVEGDEYITPPILGSNGRSLQKVQSKFFHYHPKYLVLTSGEWDHFDQFPTEAAYVDNYIHLVRSLPKDGLLVANISGKNVATIIDQAPCRVVTYSYDDPSANYVATQISLSTQLIGHFNEENIVGAYALLVELGFPASEITQSLASYHGLLQRMTILYQDDDVVVIRDLAHSPVKAKAAVEATAQRWPDRKIVAVFDVYASSLKNKEILNRLPSVFNSADLVLIPQVKLSTNQDRDQLVTGKQIVQAIRSTQPEVYYLPRAIQLMKKVMETPTPKVILLMSSGGMAGFDTELVRKLTHSKNG